MPKTLLHLNKAKIIQSTPVSVRNSARFKEFTTPTKNRSLKARQDFHAIMMSVEGMKAEYKFHPQRRWRLDYFHPETSSAYEYEGIYGGVKSRHTTLKGYTGDTNKYNEAARMGIKVFRFTAKNYQSVINYLP